MNSKLIVARNQKRWTIEQVCRLSGISDRTYRRWEKGTHRPQYSSLEILCRTFNMTADELGFSFENVGIEEVIERADERQTAIVTLTKQEAQAIIDMLQSGEHDMSRITRRDAIIKALVAATSVAMNPSLLINNEPWDRLAHSIAKPEAMNKEALEYFHSLIVNCWNLSNASQDATVEKMLPTFVPDVEAVLRQSSKNNELAASIVTQGYILASEVDRRNLQAVERYSDLAVKYSEMTNDFGIQIAALKQQATVALVARKHSKALEIYQRSLSLLPFVSPLLQARIYMGIASAYARNVEANKNYASFARKYLDLANEAFPEVPEQDTSYLYTTSGKPTLHLYNGLTYTDLGQYQKAWDSLKIVDGMDSSTVMPESIRIEIINLQAIAAIGLGDITTGIGYIEGSVNTSKALGYDMRTSEAREVYGQLRNTWPNEKRVKDLEAIFH